MRSGPDRLRRAMVATLTATACILLASCGTLSRPAVDRQLFAIDPGEPPAASPTGPVHNAATTSPSPSVTVRVRRLQVATPYSGTEFVYRTAGGAFRTDYYNGFVAPPSELLTEALIERLSRAGGFASVVSATSTVPARYLLEGNVTALYGDYTDRSAPWAVIEMRLFVLDEEANGPRLAFQKDYRAAAPIEPASVSSLVSGWNQALRSIMEQVEADLPSRLAPETSQQQADVR